jgi:hypothetical protein
MRHTRFFLFLATTTLVTAFLTSQSGLAQTAASNKAFFISRTGSTNVAVAPIGTNGNSPVITLFTIPAAVKTSGTGAISATLSMEAALWTYNLTTDINLGGKSSSSSRVALKAWVEVDGQQMSPGQVVFADRLQATGLDVNLGCSLTGCTVTGSVTLELFQRTKNANAFTFFISGLPPTAHSVVVKAQAFVECRSNGAAIPCPTGTLDGYNDASTQAAIGAASLLVEEQQNWGKL